MKQFRDLVQGVLDNGVLKSHRSGTNKISWNCDKIYKYTVSCEDDKVHNFPNLTTKKTSFRFVLSEFDFFLNGKRNVNEGSKHFKRVWGSWADNDGDLGPIYGVQWRACPVVNPLKLPTDYQDYVTLDTSISPVKNTNYGFFDQYSYVLNQIKENPDSTRHIINSWNWSDIPHMALPPCHMMFQFHVESDTYLDLKMYQRSADVLIGVPYNISFYTLLLCHVARETGLTPRSFLHIIGDAHIYEDQLKFVPQILSNKDHKLPTLTFSNNSPKLENYNHSGFIKIPVVV